MIDINRELGDTMDAYRTCEFATLTRDGTPIAWPTAALRRPDGTLLVATSLAFAQKRFPSAVLAARDDAGVPVLTRVRPTAADGWLLRPQRLVDPGATGSVREAVNTLRGARRRTASYLDRRGLTAPPVRGREFQRVADSVPVP